jgi:hypothetical protein
MSNRYYAAQSPLRGFANEVKLHAFRSPAERDAWITEQRRGHSRAYKISAAQAGRMPVAWDAVTGNFIPVIEHP